MAITIYDEDDHACICFNDLVEGEGIQSNQFLILDGDRSALIDPGGNLTFSRLYIHAGRHTTVKELDFVIASHQDPDILASINKWLVGTSCRVVIPAIWERFLPHFCAPGNYSPERLMLVPDRGGTIDLGRSALVALPAHFLHSVGNMHFYDPKAKILFSGDVGASIDVDDLRPVVDFDAHLETMIPFHRRYMVSNRACRLWAGMVRDLDLEWIIPQHGSPFRGAAMIERFVSWVETLECGVDLVGPEDYALDAALATRLTSSPGDDAA